MENRRMRRARKKARKRLLANAVLIAILVVACFALGKHVLPVNQPNGSIIEKIIEPVQSVKANAVVEKKDVLVLVNRGNRLPDGFCADLVDIGNASVDRVLVDDLNEMRMAARAEEVYFSIGSAYRSVEEQEGIFNEVVAGFIAQGNSQDVAFERAKWVAALPGCSEHETGLAIDFSLGGDAERQAEMWDWLGSNAWKYGFILRYPEGKESITGCGYEPWHYRYVGKTGARTIYNQGLALEEYLGVVEDFAEDMQIISYEGSPGGSSGVHSRGGPRSLDIVAGEETGG